MDYKFMLALMVPMSVVMVAIVISEARKKPAARPPLPPTPSRTSFLAGLSFFSGLVAIMTVTAAGILTSCVSMGEITQIPAELHPHIELASRIVLYASILPAVMAVALALAARGGISESRGLLMGRSLYRTGMLLGFLSGVLVFNGKVLNPASWGNLSFSLGGAGGAGGSGGIIETETEPELDRGWLGVEHDKADNVGVRIIRVVPGSPADRAGVLAGDWIVELDGAALSEGPSLPERIRALKPGTRVRLGVRRGNNQSTYVADLAAPFASLLALLTDQSRDDERLAVLKAAGSDRHYSSDELTKICQAFDFDDGRLKAIEPALPFLVDPPNAYQILGSLTFSDAKKKVSGWIAERTKSPK